MLGFATVDFARDQNKVTVWLTSRITTSRAGHTNAVVFDTIGLDWRRVKGMLADRYVFLTTRADESLQPLRDLKLAPCDASTLAGEVAETQRELFEVFERYRDQPGKQDLVEPQWSFVPPAADAGGPVCGPPNEVTLAAADFVRKTWTAWLETERERVKRPYMPPQGAPLRELPDAFIQRNVLYPVEIYR